MTEPNQPYGAVPPPPFPPPGAAPGGPPSGPPFPAPPGGGGSGSGGSGKGLWITLAVVGVLALVGIVVGLGLLLTGDDSEHADDKEGGDKESSDVSGAQPDEVVEGLIEAAEDGDCDAASAFLTETAKAASPCESPEFQLLASEDVESEVGDATVSGETATVPVGFNSSAGSSDYVFALEQVDGTWLVSSYTGDLGATASTDQPTDASTPTSPADPSTSPGGGVIGGNSTADAVANDPKSVVRAFLDSVSSGDCATAEDLVTEQYLEEEGNCDPKEIPSDFADQFKYTIGSPKVDDAAGTATVPVEVSFAGDKETSSVKLVKVGGLWRINEF